MQTLPSKTNPTAPETTNLVPVTYTDAVAMYQANGHRPFSFIAAPYGVVKTFMFSAQGLVAAHPDAARYDYDHRAYWSNSR